MQNYIEDNHLSHEDALFGIEKTSAQHEFFFYALWRIRVKYFSYQK